VVAAASPTGDGEDAVAAGADVSVGEDGSEGDAVSVGLDGSEGADVSVGEDESVGDEVSLGAEVSVGVGGVSAAAGSAPTKAAETAAATSASVTRTRPRTPSARAPAPIPTGPPFAQRLIACAYANVSTDHPASKEILEEWPEPARGVEEG
jgi:hypothetical protein